jgi:hypothetical protein
MAAQESMVKRTLFVLAAALVAAAGWGLGPRESTMLSPARTSFPGVRPGPCASLLLDGSSVAVVFADRDTTSLRVVEVPADGALPAVAPPPVFVDRIDVAPPLGAAFGLHAAASVGGRLRLLYLDREREDRQLLKSVTAETARAAGDPPTGWRLELVEPYGLPVAVLPRTDGKPLDVWAPGALLAREPPGRPAPAAAVQPREPGLPIAPATGGPPTGFTVWDDETGTLLAARITAAGPQVETIARAGPVHAMAEAADGTSGVVTLDAEGRRILLLERAPGATEFHTTTVTVCDGTSGLFLAWTPAGWLFVYDEVKPAQLGRWVWELAVLSPGPKVAGRPRYRRAVLSSGSTPITGVRAVVAGGSLFVLETREVLTLMKIALP